MTASRASWASSTARTRRPECPRSRRCASRALRPRARSRTAWRSCADWASASGGLEASGRATDGSEAIPALLVEIGRYDCGILWAVAGDRLKPVSAAFAYHTKPSSIALAWLASSRPCLQEFGLQPASAVSDADLAATGALGLGGPIERALGPLSYAVAAVASRSHPTLLLQAINLQRRLAQPDLDLLLSFAELSAALIIGSGTTALLHRCREWAQAGQHTAADHTPAGLNAGDAPNLPIDHAIDSRLKTLSVREREVLAHALTGAPDAMIADALAIKVATVKSHMNSLLHKLDVPSRAQLIARFGLRPPRPPNPPESTS